MLTGIDKLLESGCSPEKKDKVCRSRGGESCAFDGAMIVLQPIADTVHIVHGPIACCGNSWEGRGTLSSVGVRLREGEETSPLHRMGFTTDMNEMDIIYGSENKVYRAIKEAYQTLRPKAVFVYATCVSGLMGEDIDAVCRRAGKRLGIPVIPVNAPGFVGPKNLGNRIAGEALLDYVIGTGEPPPEIITPPSPSYLKRGESQAGGRYSEEIHINLIGEYNIAGDLWLVESLLKEAGIRVLSRITGNATFEEITYAHRAKLNVVVCSRALINVAKEMERKYGIPYVEVSFFGRTEMSKALRTIVGAYRDTPSCLSVSEKVESIISREEKNLEEKLKPFEHLRGKRAVLYTGGVKSWSFISALLDLGIEIVAVGTKKSTFHDEEKMKEILGEDAPLIEDTSPKNLLKLLKERNADILIAGGRNQYLAVKEGYPFVDVNQERHIPYAGYDGLINLAEQISNSIKFYERLNTGHISPIRPLHSARKQSILINPLKHSQSIGAAIAFQGIHNALPVIHGAQGCTFLGKVLLTKHFREPIALASTRLFSEEVIMGSDDNLSKTIEGIIEKNSPDIIGVLTSGLSEVKGDDITAAIKRFRVHASRFTVLHVPTPDYEGGLETGYAKAVAAILEIAEQGNCGLRIADSEKGLSLFTDEAKRSRRIGTVPVQRSINVLVGSHLTPADFTELRELVESFGLKPIMLPDLSALDGSRQGISPLAIGGTTVDDIKSMGSSEFTLGIGLSMERPAGLFKERFGLEYRIFEGLSGLKDTDMFMETLSLLSGNQTPEKYKRQRSILIDGMRDAHFYYGNRRICLALEPDLCLQTSRWLNEMGARVETAVMPHQSLAAEKIDAEKVIIGDLFSIAGEFDVLISNSHAEDTAKSFKIPLYQMGFPVYKILGNNSRTTIGYKGSLNVINDVANLLMRAKEVH